MTIAYLGNFKFAWTTERHIALTLEDLGHTVIRLQEDEKSVSEVILAANQADLFLWTRTYGMLQGDGFEMLRGITVPKTSFHLDYYFGISRQTQIKDDAFWFTDFVFQPDGDHLQEFKDMGINAYFSPPAIFKGGCYLLDRPLQHELVFVGSFVDYHGEWPWRREMVQSLMRSYPQFELWPRGEAIREEQLNELYASTRVVVGDSLNPEGNKTYTTDRIFETTGRGGFIIYPEIQWVSEQFGESLITYKSGDWDGLKGKIDYFLKEENQAELEERRQACFEITKSKHTYHDRLNVILETIK